MGVEPTYQPWEGRILPMNYTRICYVCQYTTFFLFRQEDFLKKRGCFKTAPRYYFFKDTAYRAFSAIPAAFSSKRSNKSKAGPLLPKQSSTP